METPLRQIRLTDFPFAFFRFRAPHRQEQGSRVCFSAPRCVSSRTRAESRKKSNGTDEGFLTRRIAQRFGQKSTPELDHSSRVSIRTRRARTRDTRESRENARATGRDSRCRCAGLERNARASAKRCRAPRATAVDFASSTLLHFFREWRFFPTAYPGANLFDRLSDRTRGGFATRDAQTRARWRETPPREYRYGASLALDRPRRGGRRGGRSTATPTFPCVPPRAARVSSMSGCHVSLKRRVTDSAVRAARGRSLGTIDANGTSPGRSHVSFARAGTASRAP